MVGGLQALLGNIGRPGGGILHRDIKGANVLLAGSRRTIAKLDDFGAAKRTETLSILSGLKGTPH